MDTQQWTPLPPLISDDHIMGSSAIVVADRLIVLVSGDSDAAVAFDTSTNAWFPLGNNMITSKRRHCAAGLLNSRIVVVGGYDGTKTLTSVESLDLDGILAPQLPIFPDGVMGSVNRKAALERWVEEVSILRKELVDRAENATRRIQSDHETERKALEKVHEEKMKGMQMMNDLWVRKVDEKLEDATKQIEVLKKRLESVDDASVDDVSRCVSKESCCAGSRGVAFEEEVKNEVLGQERESSHNDDSFLSLLVCPITKKVMKDPVMAADGYTYERWAIQHAFAQVGCGEELRSPVTGDAMAHRSLIPNAVILGMLRGYSNPP